MVIIVMFRLVGGPFDGEPGLGWAGGAHDRIPPAQIVVWRCAGASACGMVFTGDTEGCQGPHVCWIESDEAIRAPASAVPYSLVSCDLSGEQGVAHYVHGGVDVSTYIEARGRAVLYG